MITSSRITLARKRRCLSIAELSARVGVSAQSLTNYENDRAEPSAETLEKIATAVDFPVSFFHQLPLEDPVTTDTVSFRARSKLAAGPREGALTTSRLAIALHAWIDKRFKLPAADLPTLGRSTPEEAAERVRTQWGLGNTPISNVVHLLEAHGVRVFSLPHEFADVDAFSFWRRGTPFVFLNTAKTAERGRFDAAHELGHLILHGEERPTVSPQAEREANAFASALLMPRDSILARMPKNPLVDQIIKAKRIWKVAAMALTYRLHDLDLLSDWHYRRTYIELGKRGYRQGEPEGIRLRETSQLLGKVFQALKAKDVTMADIAKEHHVTPDELNSWVFGLVITTHAGEGDQRRTASQDRARLTLVHAGEPRTSPRRTRRVQVL